MAWMSLALRKQGLKASVSELNAEDIQLSRKVRALHRHLSHEKSIYNADMKHELSDAKKAYMEIRNRRPKDHKSDEYTAWSDEYNDAKEDYQAQKQDIQDYYDDLNQELEEEAQEEEDALQDEITRTETQRDAQSAELQAINDEIKNQIDSSAIKF